MQIAVIDWIHGIQVRFPYGGRVRSSSPPLPIIVVKQALQINVHAQTLSRKNLGWILFLRGERRATTKWLEDTFYLFIYLESF